MYRSLVLLLLGLLSVAAQPAAAQPAAVGDPEVLAAGDIATGGTGDELTAQLIAAHPRAIVLTLGDNAYPDGSLDEFLGTYGPSWGTFVARTYPSVGNHDYHQAAGAGYDAYFRQRGRPIGVLGKHWYSFDHAGWHFVALNSNCNVVRCGAGSEQAAWLEADLSAHPAACTLAYWHHPRFSSGRHGSDPRTQALYEILDRHGADVILSGHDHDYERFAPQDAFGNASSTAPTQFVVGTGGAPLRRMAGVAPHSVTRATHVYGVLQITLHPHSYDWKFLPASGSAYTDSGRAECVAPPPPSD